MVTILIVLQVGSIAAILAIFLGAFGRLGDKLIIPLFVVVVLSGSLLAILGPKSPFPYEECGSGPTAWEC